MGVASTSRTRGVAHLPEPATVSAIRAHTFPSRFLLLCSALLSAGTARAQAGGLPLLGSFLGLAEAFTLSFAFCCALTQKYWIIFSFPHTSHCLLPRGFLHRRPSHRLPVCPTRSPASAWTKALISPDITYWCLLHKPSWIHQSWLQCTELCVCVSHPQFRC